LKAQQWKKAASDYAWATLLHDLRTVAPKANPASQLPENNVLPVVNNAPPLSAKGGRLELRSWFGENWQEDMKKFKPHSKPLTLTTDGIPSGQHQFFTLSGSLHPHIHKPTKVKAMLNGKEQDLEITIKIVNVSGGVATLDANFRFGNNNLGDLRFYNSPGMSKILGPQYPDIHIANTLRDYLPEGTNPYSYMPLGIEEEHDLLGGGRGKVPILLTGKSTVPGLSTFMVRLDLTKE
jgi:hypothetical protein